MINKSNRYNRWSFEIKFLDRMFCIVEKAGDLCRHLWSTCSIKDHMIRVDVYVIINDVAVYIDLNIFLLAICVQE